MTYARKVDSNHADLKKVALQMGCTVAELFRVGDDFPDLLIGAAGVDQLVEVKSDDGDLSPGQRVFHANWRGRAVAIARTREDMVDIVNAMRKR